MSLWLRLLQSWALGHLEARPALPAPSQQCPHGRMVLAGLSRCAAPARCCCGRARQNLVLRWLGDLTGVHVACAGDTVSAPAHPREPCSPGAPPADCGGLLGFSFTLFTKSVHPGISSSCVHHCLSGAKAGDAGRGAGRPAGSEPGPPCRLHCPRWPVLGGARPAGSVCRVQRAPEACDLAGRGWQALASPGPGSAAAGGSPGEGVPEG